MKIKSISIQPKKQSFGDAYIIIKGDQTYFSKVSKINLLQQKKYPISMVAYNLNISVWSYQPHVHLKSWNFSHEQIKKMKEKNIIQGNAWILVINKISCIRKVQSSLENKVPNFISTLSTLSSAKQSRKQLSLKRKQQKRKICSIVKNLRQKKSVKKALKSTIDYNLGVQGGQQEFKSENTKKKVFYRTAVVTPAIEQSSYKMSKIFYDYGLNQSESNQLISESKSLEKNFKIKSTKLLR